ncbi:MAG: aspartate kinase [Methanomicrobiales archaeon]
MRLVMKFGGTSIADSNCINRVADILDHHHRAGNELVAVVSAMAGVTDQLHAIADEVTAGGGEAAIEAVINSLRGSHLRVLETVAPGLVTEVGAEIDDRLMMLKNILTAVLHLQELTGRSRDYIISFGERLSSLLLAAALRERGIDAVAMDGCEAGITTTDTHGSAIPLPESEKHIRSRVIPLLGDSVPVITGYMGCTPTGIVTTLGRGGSDFSAAVIGAAIDAEEIWIWTDVDGVMTADPRIIPEARVLPVVSYLEAMELSYFGAKVLHPRSVEPGMQKRVPIRVKNTFNPSHPGTCIVHDGQPDQRVVKSITYIQKVAMVNINGAQMMGRPGVARAIFSILGREGVNIMMISQGSSEANISLVVDDAHLSSAVGALNECVRQGLVREVTSNRDVIAMAVVGEGMIGTPGTGGRVFSALGEAGINIMMISQGSSEVNISFVVREQDGPHALRVLHDEFRLAEEVA